MATGAAVEIELQQRPSRPTSTFDDGQQLPEVGQAFSLPPADGGKDAWLLLFSCFCMEGLVWGLPMAFGVFQNYYSTHPPFNSDPSNIPVIGTVAIGLLYLGSPLSLLALQRFPQYRRRSMIIGLFLSCASLAAASFSNLAWQLILTQGIAYAIGGSMLYYPTLLFLDEWFIRRKGLAFGLAWAGTAVAGVIFPLIIESALSHYTFRTILRAWSLLLFALTIPLLPLLKPRLPITTPTNPPLPPSSHRSGTRNTRFLRLRLPQTLSFTLTRTFLVYELGTVLQGLGYFIPSIYLPAYASRVLHLSPSLASVTLVLLNVGLFFGYIATGFLVDRLAVASVICALTVGATLATTLLWGLSSASSATGGGGNATGGVVLLYAFSVLYGFFAGSFSSTWPGVIREVVDAAARTRASVAVDTGLVYGLLIAGRGLGSIVSGPLSEALLRRRLADGGGQGAAKAFGYGSDYGALIVFTGVSMLLGGTGFVAKVLRLI